MSPNRSNRAAVGWGVLMLIAFLAPGQPASADPLIALVTQERWVRASVSADVATGGDGDSDRVDAPDFGPFDENVGVQAHASDAGGSVFVSASARQTSWIDAESIHGHGSAGYDLSIAGTNGSGWGEASSSVEVTFQLAEESDYALEGFLHGYGGGASVTLIGPAGTIFQESNSHFEETRVREIGTLPAGEYTIQMRSFCSDGAFGQIQLGGLASYGMMLRFGPLGFTGPGGEVPDGRDVPGGPPLMVERLSNGYVRVTWGYSCRFGDHDYAVYEGELGDPVALGWVTCSTERERKHVFQPTADAAWFLVVPHDEVTEGSWGDTGDGIERTPISGACLPQLLGEPVCP